MVYTRLTMDTKNERGPICSSLKPGLKPPRKGMHIHTFQPVLSFPRAGKAAEVKATEKKIP